MSESVAVLTDRWILGEEYLRTLPNMERWDKINGIVIQYDGSTYRIFTDWRLLKGVPLSRYVLVGNPSHELIEAAIINLS